MRGIIIGAIAFTLGAVSSPQAANVGEHEALTLAKLCERFKASAEHDLRANLLAGGMDERGHFKSDAHRNRNVAAEVGAVKALMAMRTMFCR